MNMVVRYRTVIVGNDYDKILALNWLKDGILLGQFPKNGFSMLKNYFLTAWRNLVKNKIYSFINILGLATGMAVVMLIGLWMHDELSANTNHANYATLYKIMMNQTFDGRRDSQDAMPYAAGEELKLKFQDFKAVAMSDAV